MQFNTVGRVLDVGKFGRGKSLRGGRDVQEEKKEQQGEDWGEDTTTTAGQWCVATTILAKSKIGGFRSTTELVGANVAVVLGWCCCCVFVDGDFERGGVSLIRRHVGNIMYNGEGGQKIQIERRAWRGAGLRFRYAAN
jgi:hypothetical protein